MSSAALSAQPLASTAGTVLPAGCAGGEHAPRVPRSPTPLAGRHIVVTRPAAQAASLARAIEDAGGVPVLFPVLAIFDLEDTGPLTALAAHLGDYDLAVFVSANAIDKALSVLLAQGPWPVGLKAAVMGKSSERTLASFGITNVIAPTERFDSEALLALPALADMAGKKVIVFRGDAGRELLGDTLQQRGARVDYIACYRRGRPELSPALLLDLWGRRELDALTLTSSEGLRNLTDMLGEAGRARLAITPLFVPHQRIAEEAHRLGLGRVITTPPGDDGLVAGLIDFFETSGPA